MAITTISVTLQRTDRSMLMIRFVFQMGGSTTNGILFFIVFFGNTLPETNSSHLKADGWLLSFWKGLLFSGELFVSGRVGMLDHTQRNVLSQASIQWYNWWISRRFFVYLKLALSTLRELRSQGMMFCFAKWGAKEPQNPDNHQGRSK